MSNDPEGTTRLVVRVLQAFADRVDRAAAYSGLDRSKWMREALEAGVVREESEMLRRLGQKPPTSPRTLGATRTSVPGLCIHPLTGREERGLSVWCKVCGTELRRLG